MRESVTAAEAHRQYQETISAFRRWIPDPTLRLAFSREADSFFRRCALGVWQADNAVGITPPARGILQRHLLRDRPRPLRSVLGGGHRRGRL
ncbi:MAG: hypothetical protein ACLTKB_09725 [Lawsonibacter sp.]